MKRAFPILAVITAVLLAYALYQALVVAPADAQQGDVYRIIYYHVPSGWTAMLLFFINFVASIQYLVSTKPSTKSAANAVVIAVGIAGCIVPFIPQVRQWLHATGMYSSSVATTAVIIVALYFLAGRYFSGEELDVLAVTTAEVGVVFCTIVLITGPIWARPVWGIWWAPGDIRLTSTLVLWLIYVSYLILRRFSDSAQTQKLAAALAVFGALDMPLVYFSIWFFRTQHPQPVIGGGGSMDPKMLDVLMISWTAFLFFAFLVCWSRYRLEILRREVEQAHAMQSLSGAAASVAGSIPAVSSRGSQ
jgi:ABC-type transport system involved in cytochrome c biogenesis permease subunit